jgi:hypothetical protein
MNTVFETFAKAVPSFVNEAISKEHSNLLKHVRKGCLSDLPDVNLYFGYNVADDNFKMNTCARGTSQLENFHSYLRRCIRASGLRPELAQALLINVVHRW